MGKKIKFWLNETTAQEYIIDKEELIDIFEKIKHNNPSNEELAQFLQDEYDLEDLKKFDSYRMGETTTENQDLKDLDIGVFEYAIK